MNNDIKNEISWLLKSYSSRIQKAMVMPSPENWQLATVSYNHLCGYRDGLEAAGLKDEANYLSNFLKIDIDK